MRVRVSEAMAVPAHVKAVTVSGSKDSHLLARPGQENKQVLQVANAAILGTKPLVLHTKHNTHEQWDQHNQEKYNTRHGKQLLLRLSNQVKHHGTLGGISDKRHLRSLKNEENVNES